MRIRCLLAILSWALWLRLACCYRRAREAREATEDQDGGFGREDLVREAVAASKELFWVS
jgi:hypothetical protein